MLDKIISDACALNATLLNNKNLFCVEETFARYITHHRIKYKLQITYCTM